MGGRATAIPIEPNRVCVCVCVYRDDHSPQPMGMKASQQDEVRGQAVCYIHTHTNAVYWIFAIRSDAEETKRRMKIPDWNEFSWSAVTANCCMCEGGSLKSGAISFLLPQQQSCVNLVLAHLEGGNKVCVCVYIYVCVCVCVLKELILSRFAGEMRKCLYPSGTTNQATVLYSHSSLSVSLSLSHCLSMSLALSFSLSRLLFRSQSLHFSPGITKFSSLYFLNPQRYDPDSAGNQ